VPIATNTLDLCPHDHRPGTTVCLHCRHASLLALRKRRRKSLLRIAGALLVVLALFSGGTIGTLAVRGYVAERGKTASGSPPIAQQAGTIRLAVAGEAPARGAVRPVALHASTRQLSPIIGLGETPLADSIRALRADSAVTVFFDLPMIRTRRSDKFERFVRSTLPEIYGPAMDSLLALLPYGTIAQQGDLLTELPIRGARLSLANGWRLTVWPEIRPAYDGPLVVRYRVIAE
jgi:hypothetical protein